MVCNPPGPQHLHGLGWTVQLAGLLRLPGIFQTDVTSIVRQQTHGQSRQQIHPAVMLPSFHSVLSKTSFKFTWMEAQSDVPPPVCDTAPVGHV